MSTIYHKKLTFLVSTLFRLTNIITEWSSDKPSFRLVIESITYVMYSERRNNFDANDHTIYIFVTRLLVLFIRIGTAAVV